MRLSSKFEEFGYFWLPSDKKKEVPGILKITEFGKIHLELYGFFSTMQDHFEQISFSIPKYIFGRLKKTGLVTILDSNCQFTDAISSIHSCHYICSYVFLGTNIEIQDIQFTKLQFSIEGVHEWLSNKTSQLLDQEIYKDSIVLQFNLSTNIELKFLPINLSSSESKIGHKANICLESKTPLFFKEFIDFSSILNKFFCFALHQPVMINFMSFFLTDTKAKNPYKEIEIFTYFESTYSPKKPLNLDFLDWPLLYSDTKDDLKNILTKWVNGSRTFSPTFNLFFAVVYGSYGSLEGSFLSLTQGLESLHRRQSDKTHMELQEFKNLSETLLNACPESQKNWLKEKLKHANEQSFRSRIIELIEPCKIIFGTKSEQKELVNKIINARNYYVHYSAIQQNPDTFEIDVLNYKIICIFYIQFLLLIGFCPQKILDIIKKRYIFDVMLDFKAFQPKYWK